MFASISELVGRTTCKDKILHIFCGFGGKGIDEEKEKAMQRHLEKVSELKQDPVARIVLNIGMVVILFCGTFLYFFWSFWQYEP